LNFFYFYRIVTVVIISVNACKLYLSLSSYFYRIAIVWITSGRLRTDSTHIFFEDSHSTWTQKLRDADSTVCLESFIKEKSCSLSIEITIYKIKVSLTDIHPISIWCIRTSFSTTFLPTYSYSCDWFMYHWIYCACLVRLIFEVCPDVHNVR